MMLFESISVSWIVMSVIVIILFFLLLYEHRARTSLETKYQAMALVLKNGRQQQEYFAKQFNELRAGSIGMGQKLAELAMHYETLSEKQSQLEMLDTDGRFYSRASKMAELGADLTELMEECELPKAEAELLLNIKTQRPWR